MNVTLGSLLAGMAAEALPNARVVAKPLKPLAIREIDLLLER